MIRNKIGILLAALVAMCPACQSMPAQSPAAPVEAKNEAVAADSEGMNAQESVESAAVVPVDLSGMTEKSVTPYVQGSSAFTLADILPLMSDSSGYTQKWEFYVYTKPYEARIKFEISNFAFSKNEGKIKGYVRKYDGETQVEEYPISESYGSGSWKASKGALDLEFGDYRLSWKDGLFHLKGSFEHGSFEYDIPANPWKPGTGDVYFGNSKDNVFKYSILTYHKLVVRGHFVVDGEDVEVSGQAYANHYAATVPVYDMFDEVSDFRMRSDELLVEFRYYVPSSKYDSKQFGFMFAAFEGQPLVGSTELIRTTLDKWLDDQNYGYEIDSRQRIEAREGGNKAVFEMLSAEPRPSDPYADLSTFKRNVAMRFAKPIEYSIPIDWILHLDVDGYQAKIPYSNTYTITRLR